MDRLPEFPPFEYADKADAGPKWDKWLERLELLFTGMDIDDNGRKRALLLHYAGERVFDIYTAEKGDSPTSYQGTKQVLSTYFSPRTNVQMAVYKFRNSKQLSTQTLDEYVTELRKLAKDCEFNDVNKEILSQIIQHCCSNRLRRRALREPDMTLQNLMDLGRAMEVAESQAQTMEEQCERAVNFVNRSKSSFKPRRTGKSKGQFKDKAAAATNGTCRNCGGPYPHTTECPAKDTGASVNVLDQDAHLKIGSPKLKRETNPTLLPYGGGKQLVVFGSCWLSIEWKGTVQSHKFYVVKGNYGALLGYQTCLSFGLIQVVHQLSCIADKHSDLFVGVGKLKDRTVRIHVDETVKPVAQRSRRTPFHLRPKVEAELQKLLDDDIIERVRNEPTPWISPIVCVPKKNPEEIRVCVDMRKANKAIVRERHLMPTIDELIHDLNGAAIFSKLDLRQGYHQLELEPASRSITTFNTHIGIFRNKRLNFGVSAASEIFQETIRNVIQGIRGAKNTSDDIQVFGKSQEDHDAALTATFKALQDNGLKLNRSKCEFNSDRITFFGLVFSKAGISPDPEKVSAIQDAQRPSNASEIRSFLGMTAYGSRFIPDYSTVSEPLRRLTRSDIDWQWASEQESAFEKLKTLLSSDIVISYNNPNKPIEVVVDASPVGLGAILTQENKVVAFASRSLSGLESRYSQTEREALAIIWACEHFDMYKRGAPHFRVVTDHKPLLGIWKRPKPPLRIERWGLRLQPYKLEIVYRPGKDNPADYMSQHPVESHTTSREEDMAEKYLHFVAQEATLRFMSLDEVKLATSSNKTILKAIDLVRTGRWQEVKSLNDSEVDLLELQSLRNIRDELVVYSDNVLMRNGCIVLPKSLRSRAVNIAHEGHQGISRTKAILRSKTWFPGLNDAVENALKHCLACQSVTDRQNRFEPLQMSDMPSGPWQNLSADFCGPLPTGEYLFVVIDENSRFPVVEIMKSTSAAATIPVLDKLISTFGLPKVIKTDNGSPFNSHLFREFAENIGFQHRRITPRWPKANSQAESFNKPMIKAVRAARIERKNWKQELFKFLRQYRGTPHPSTGFAPFSLLFNRETRTKLPQVPAHTRNAVDECARQNDDIAKRKMKNNANFNSSPYDLRCGDVVLMRNDRKTDKLMPSFDPNPYTVVAKKGSMVSVSSAPGTRTTRNASCFKRIPESFAPRSSEPDLAEGEEMILDQDLKHTTENSLKKSSVPNLNSENNQKPTSMSEKRVTPANDAPGQYKTRSGRVVRKPAALMDFVK